WRCAPTQRPGLASPAAHPVSGGLFTRPARVAQPRLAIDTAQRRCLLTTREQLSAHGLLITRPHGKAARLLIGLQRQQCALLRLRQQVVERAETIGTLVETGMTALDGLLDHRAPDGLTLPTLLEQRIERLDHQLERVVEVGPAIGTRCRFGGSRGAVASEIATRSATRPRAGPTHAGAARRRCSARRGRSRPGGPGLGPPWPGAAAPRSPGLPADPVVVVDELVAIV